MYKIDYATLHNDLPNEGAVREQPNGQYSNTEDAWREVASHATSRWLMVGVAIDNIDIGKLPGTPEELRQERCGLVRRYRRLEQWIKFAKARC